MAHTLGDTGSLAEGLRRAYAARDLDGLAALLAEDVRWGDDDNPRKCRNRAEVLARFSGRMADGVDADITEVSEGANGILFGLAVRWPKAMRRTGDRFLFHVCLVRDGRIVEIQRYDDRHSAARAAGVSA